ncbi:unnamed protein product [Clonostachys byssicola]|uniref:Uncharacterized protein n=1 Tax=Clonostachys byssicola TaxID=160290 RepID=A0A9N9Y3D7_9HYPO|nr:unnamed protein product [Clonostachys byssicola]
MPEGEERSAALMARAAVAKRKQQEKNSMSMPLQEPARIFTPIERGSKYTEDIAATRTSNVPSAKAPTSQASSTCPPSNRQSTLDPARSTSRKSATRIVAVEAPHRHIPSSLPDEENGSFGLQAAQTKAERRADQKSTNESHSPFYRLLLNPQPTDPSSAYLPPTIVSPQLSITSSQQTLRPKREQNVQVRHDGGALREAERWSGSSGQQNSTPSVHTKTQPLVEDAGDGRLQTIKRAWHSRFYYLYGKMTGVEQANAPSVSGILWNLQNPLYQVLSSLYGIAVRVYRFIKVLISWHKLLGLLLFIWLCGYVMNTILNLPGFRQISTALTILYQVFGQASRSQAQQQHISQASMELQKYMYQIDQLSFKSGVLDRPLPPPQQEEERGDGFQVAPFFIPLFSRSAAVTGNTRFQENETPCDGNGDSGDDCFFRVQFFVQPGQTETTKPLITPHFETGRRLEIQLEDQWRHSYGSIYNASSRYTILSGCLKAESQQLADLLEAIYTWPAADREPTSLARWLSYLSQRCHRKTLIVERINKLQAIMSRLHECLTQFRGPLKHDGRFEQDPIIIQLSLTNDASYNYLQYYSPRAKQTYPLPVRPSRAEMNGWLSSYLADEAIKSHKDTLLLTSDLLHTDDGEMNLESSRKLEDIERRVTGASESITSAQALVFEKELAGIIVGFLNSSRDYWTEKR